MKIAYIWLQIYERSNCFSETNQTKKKPTLHNLSYNMFSRPVRSKCMSRPGIGCTPRILNRLRATPGRGRPAGCTGHGFDCRSLHTSQVRTSLHMKKKKHCCELLYRSLLSIDGTFKCFLNTKIKNIEIISSSV